MTMVILKQYITLIAKFWYNGSVLDHTSLPPVFESRHGHIWRMFHLWLRFTTFGGRSAHLAYHVHRSGRKTPIIIILHLISSLYMVCQGQLGMCLLRSEQQRSSITLSTANCPSIINGSPCSQSGVWVLVVSYEVSRSAQRWIRRSINSRHYFAIREYFSSHL